MPFTIYRNAQPDRLIVMGGPKPSTSAPSDQGQTKEKEMPEEKQLGEETGVKKVHQERADKQGPVGTGADQPSREQPDADVKIGGREEKNA